MLLTAELSLSLLNLRATEGLLDVAQGRVPIHLLKELIHVALLGHQDGALAIGHRFEELHGQASNAFKRLLKKA